MSVGRLVTVVFLPAAVWVVGCAKQDGNRGPKPISSAEMRAVIAQRFVDLHQTYLAADGAKYTSLLRATLRHARRLAPAQCVVMQRELVGIGNSVGYDGLEPVWLVYQDCAAAGSAKSFDAQRTENATLLRQGLHFKRREPLPQLPLRVTYWNSALERGLRADAVRALIKQYASASPKVTQSWSLYQLTVQPNVRQALCGLAIQPNQFGKKALADLLRQAQCLAGTGPSAEDLCNKLFPKQGGATGASTTPAVPLEGVSSEDKRRLGDFCNQLPGGELSGAGIDDLDSYSSDHCNSEDTTRLYDTEKIVGLMMDCYSSGKTNPFASGGATSANYDRILNKIVTWTPDNGRTYEATLMTGKSTEDPGRRFYGAAGKTPQEARNELLKQLNDNPPPGYTVTEQPDGSTTVSTEYDQKNPDGTTSHVTQSTNYGTDGSESTNKQAVNSNGSGSGGTSSKSADGSGSSINLEWDSNGNVTKKTETTTDKDGKTTTTTTEYDHDADGNVTQARTSKSTTLPGEEGGFDPHNPACQQLMAIEVMPGSNRVKIFNDMFKRGRQSDPRTVYPTPDQADNWSQQPFCGAPGVGSNDPPAKCNSVMLCAEGTYMDDTCHCKQAVGGSIALQGCWTARCPEGTTAVPVGGFGCTCQSSEGTPDRPRPGPGPDVSRSGLSELIWNRPDGKIFVTDQMAKDSTSIANRSRSDRSKVPPR